MDWKIMKLEEMSALQLYRIMKLRSEVFVVEQSCAYLDPDGADERSDHLFLEEKGEILAYCRILPRGITFPEVSIGRVVVSEKLRGQGISRKMMKRAMDYVITELKESEIQISAQAYLVAFYSGLGFQAVSEEYLEDGIPHVDMVYKRYELG